MQKGIRVKDTRYDSVFNACVVLFLAIFSFIVLYPLYIILIASISDPYAVMRGEVLLYPVDISFIGYQKLFRGSMVPRAYLNTILYTGLGTALNVVLTISTAYALTTDFIGRKVVNFYFLFTMFFSGGLIPTFLMIRSYGLYNSPMIFILSGAISVWNLIIARTYIRSTLPQELYEAASIDGCSHFRYLLKMVFPLSTSLVGVLGVYYGVGHWNDFMTGIIYISNRNFLPLQNILKELLASLQATSTMDEMLNDVLDNELQMRIAESVKYASIVISTAPVILLYIALQRFFVNGVMIGSVKG